MSDTDLKAALRKLAYKMHGHDPDVYFDEAWPLIEAELTRLETEREYYKEQKSLADDAVDFLRADLAALRAQHETLTAERDWLDAKVKEFIHEALENDKVLKVLKADAAKWQQVKGKANSIRGLRYFCSQTSDGREPHPLCPCKPCTVERDLLALIDADAPTPREEPT